MIEALAKKLGKLSPLTSSDIGGLSSLSGCRLREYPARAEIVHAGTRSPNAVFVLQGWLAESIILEDGRRQIVALPMEGDLCEVGQTASGDRGSSLSVLERSTVLLIPRAPLLALAQQSPTLMRALWSDAITDASIRREWIVNMGRRSAHERIGHLMCELFHRQQVLGSAVGNSCTLPLTQSDMADVTGLTPVHINRTLQQMRAKNMIKLRRNALVIQDYQALARSSMFDPGYLYRWPLEEERKDVRSPCEISATVPTPIRPAAVRITPTAARTNGAFPGHTNGNVH